MLMRKVFYLFYPYFITFLFIRMNIGTRFLFCPIDSNACEYLAKPFLALVAYAFNSALRIFLLSQRICVSYLELLIKSIYLCPHTHKPKFVKTSKSVIGSSEIIYLSHSPEVFKMTKVPLAYLRGRLSINFPPLNELADSSNLNNPVTDLIRNHPVIFNYSIILMVLCPKNSFGKSLSRCKILARNIK